MLIMNVDLAYDMAKSLVLGVVSIAVCAYACSNHLKVDGMIVIVAKDMGVAMALVYGAKLTDLLVPMFVDSGSGGSRVDNVKVPDYHRPDARVDKVDAVSLGDIGATVSLGLSSYEGWMDVVE